MEAPTTSLECRKTEAVQEEAKHGKHEELLNATMSIWPYEEGP